MIPDSLRSLAYRAGRWLYCKARGEVHNDPTQNGEYWLLRKIIELRPDATLLDIGANLGDWTATVLDAARGPVQVHAFEPSPVTNARLRERFAGRPQVHCREAAVSSQPGELRFYSVGDGNGTNSLSDVSGGNLQIVKATSVDVYLAGQDVRDVAMVKVDTEGFDFDVMQGAVNSLAAGRIEVLQFEYNWRWLINHRALRDVFQFRDASAPGYLLGRLREGTIEFHDAWHFELDRFFEGNYVLMRRDSPLVSLGASRHFDASNTTRRL